MLAEFLGAILGNPSHRSERSCRRIPLPSGGYILPTDEIMPVGDLYLVRGEGNRFEMDVLQYLLHFVDVRVGCGRQQSGRWHRSWSR